MPRLTPSKLVKLFHFSNVEVNSFERNSARETSGQILKFQIIHVIQSIEAEMCHNHDMRTGKKRHRMFL